MTNPVPNHFRPRSDAEVLALVEANPLAWLVLPDLSAFLMPVSPRTCLDGRLVGFRGHVPLRIAEKLRIHKLVLILFTGDTAYISPSWFDNRKQAPTWASQSASFLCDVSVGEDPAELRRTMEVIVHAMEADRAQSWNLKELGHRYEGLARGIAYYDADIVEQRSAFRLGQDEDERTFENVMSGLEAEGRTAFAKTMASFRP